MHAKTAETELYRLFLIEGLPEPLLPASTHLQLFDNYIEGTRLRIRNIRDPYANTWTHLLEQQFLVEDEARTVAKFAEIHLNDAEYALLERFEGREIRKNRYFHEIDGREFKFDIFLGKLWGLSTARVDFSTAAEAEEFVPPPFAVIEVSGDSFFTGASLVDKDFAAVQAEMLRRSTAAA